MRLAFSTSLIVPVVAATLVSGPAAAGVKIRTETRTYVVTGNSGAALVDAMDRAGPRHGFMTRAIAQTSYTVDWDIQVRATDRTCRLTQATPTLNLTYIFPQARGLPASLSKRWKTFLAGVRGHERKHGRIATEMVQAAARSVSGLAIANDPSCNRVRREARRRIDAVYASYEARQVAFDASEHRHGGRVEKLVDALIARR
jgi:predicted secreted Zn-dependent protease